MKFTFIDLFAGIGGIRIAFERAGGECVFSSESDKWAQMTYELNFGEKPHGDITQIDKTEIPDHDVLCAGFPCQPFSKDGVSKKNALGVAHGLDDPTGGTMFFEVKEVLRLKRPKAFFLENVKNLVTHDKGRTFEVIRAALEDELGYIVNWRIVNGVNWLPQNRERVFIVGYDPQQVNISKDDIVIPTKPDEGYVKPKLSDIIKRSPRNAYPYTIGYRTWSCLQKHKAKYQAKGNGFGYNLITFPIADDAYTATLKARYFKDGSEILIEQPLDRRPRRLTLQEAMQLQGFDPKTYRFYVSKTQAFKQLGNSVLIPAVEATAREIAQLIKAKNGENTDG